MPDKTVESVIQSVVHIELPAFRDVELSALQVDLQWAEDVESHMHIQHQAASHGGTQELQLSDKVFHISFRTGKGELFRKMLLNDKEFKPLSKSLRDAGYPLELPPSKTIVLVRPEQYLEVVNSHTLSCRKLKRYNVVIAESEEYIMQEVLLRLAYKQTPRENVEERVEHDLDSKVCKRNHCTLECIRIFVFVRIIIGLWTA